MVGSIACVAHRGVHTVAQRQSVHSVRKVSQHNRGSKQRHYAVVSLVQTTNINLQCEAQSALIEKVGILSESSVHHLSFVTVHHRSPMLVLPALDFPMFVLHAFAFPMLVLLALALHMFASSALVFPAVEK